MNLNDLVGKHMLDAVDFTNEAIKEDWDDRYVDSAICRFRLDGVVYMAIEDPDDGYRSMMRELVIDENADMKNVFPPIEVLARHRSKSLDSSIEFQSDILDLVDTATGEIVLTVGTEDTNDYYPLFVANFIPEAMITNKGKEEL